MAWGWIPRPWLQELHVRRLKTAPLLPSRHDTHPCRQDGVITLYAINARRYHAGMTIRSFKCADTQALFERKRVSRFANLQAVARRKLEQLEWSAQLSDLRVPPGNRLEALRDDRKGQHSIRVNDQWRIYFVWTTDGPKDVEIVDYH